MKKCKKALPLLTAALACLISLTGTPLAVHAAEPVTYCVKYDSGNNDWRFQVGSAWDDASMDRELYYLQQDIKDGDLLVIEGNGPRLELDVNVRLSNLTINHSDNAVIAAKGIDNCYVLRDSICAVTGDVTNAYVYDNAVANFNSNVTNLEVIGTKEMLNATVAVVGTVDHLKGSDSIRTHYELYSFAAGKLSINEGDVKTDAAYFSTTPKPGSSSNNTPSSSTATSSSKPVSSGEYDDVPKTGESNLIFWLLGIAAVCLLGSLELKKR